MNIAEAKAAMREEIRAKRRAIEADERKAHETALEDRLLNLPALKHAKCIATYHPFADEARFATPLDRVFLLDQHPIIAFPIIRSNENMSFVSFDANDDRTILESPLQVVDDIDPERIVKPEAIDLMLIPGIAFDRHGNRLGQGGGYYDRYLMHVRDDCLTIGIAFDEQVVDEVPHEYTDVQVGYIVTPTRVISAEK